MIKVTGETVRRLGPEERFVRNHNIPESVSEGFEADVKICEEAHR